MKRTTGKHFLATFFLLFALISMSLAQNPSIELTTTSEALNHETTFQVDLHVGDFTDMLGVQFSLNWDTDVLSFVSVENFGIADISLANNFGLMHAGEGILSFLWYDINLQGVSLDDDTVLFSVTFTVVGNADDTAVVSFSNSPTVIEFSNTTVVLDPELGVFEMLVGTLGSVYNSAPELIQVEEVYPNPINNKSQVDFQLAHSTDLNFFIFDESGKMVSHTREYFTSGKHSFYLNETTFPASGKYLLKMVSEEFEVLQKLVFIGK